MAGEAPTPGPRVLFHLTINAVAWPASLKVITLGKRLDHPPQSAWPRYLQKLLFDAAQRTNSWRHCVFRCERLASIWGGFLGR